MLVQAVASEQVLASLVQALAVDMAAVKPPFAQQYAAKGFAMRPWRESLTLLQQHEYKTEKEVLTTAAQFRSGSVGFPASLSDLS